VSASGAESSPYSEHHRLAINSGAQARDVFNRGGGVGAPPRPPRGGGGGCCWGGLSPIPLSAFSLLGPSGDDKKPPYRSSSSETRPSTASSTAQGSCREGLTECLWKTFCHLTKLQQTSRHRYRPLLVLTLTCRMPLPPPTTECSTPQKTSPTY